MPESIEELKAKWRQHRMVLYVVNCAREFYRDPKNRAEFEKYYLEKHGEPYVWKHPKFIDDDERKTPYAGT